MAEEGACISGCSAHALGRHGPLILENPFKQGAPSVTKHSEREKLTDTRRNSLFLATHQATWDFGLAARMPPARTTKSKAQLSSNRPHLKARGLSSKLNESPPPSHRRAPLNSHRKSQHALTPRSLAALTPRSRAAAGGSSSAAAPSAASAAPLANAPSALSTLDEVEAYVAALEPARSPSPAPLEDLTSKAVEEAAEAKVASLEATAAKAVEEAAAAQAAAEAQAAKAADEAAAAKAAEEAATAALAQAEARHASELAEMRRQLEEASMSAPAPHPSSPPAQGSGSEPAAITGAEEQGEAAAATAAAGGDGGAGGAAAPAAAPSAGSADADALAAAVAEVSRLREALAESEEALHAAEDRLDERDHQVTVAVASEALRGIEMMERMEKNIEQRKDREAATLGKLKDAFRGASAQAARDEMASVMATKLAEVEAEAEERALEDATAITELREALKQRQDHAHAADGEAGAGGGGGGATGLSPKSTISFAEIAGDGEEESAADVDAAVARPSVRAPMLGELKRMKTQLSLMQREEERVASKVDAHLARLDLHLKAGSVLSQLHESRALLYGPVQHTVSISALTFATLPGFEPPKQGVGSRQWGAKSKSYASGLGGAIGEAAGGSVFPSAWHDEDDAVDSAVVDAAIAGLHAEVQATAHAEAVAETEAAAGEEVAPPALEALAPATAEESAPAEATGAAEAAPEAAMESGAVVSVEGEAGAEAEPAAPVEVGKEEAAGETVADAEGEVDFATFSEHLSVRITGDGEEMNVQILT